MASSTLVSPEPVSPNSTTIFKLPHELLVAIFQHLSRRDRLLLQLVCRHFLVVARDPVLWRRVVVRPAYKIWWPQTKEASFISAIKRATMLSSLQCSNVVVQDTDALFSALATCCPRLEKLCVPHRTVDRRNVELLVQKCPNLTELCLNVRGPDDYESIKQLKKLRSIRVSGDSWGFGISAAQDMLLKQLANRCVFLKELHIDDTGFGIDTLASLAATEMAQRLTGLTLKVTGSVKQFMSLLDKFTALEDLTLRFRPETKNPYFSQCTRLKDLKRFKIECENVDQEHLYDLFYNNKFERLRTLKLKKARYFDDTVLEVVYSQSAPNLEELHLDGLLYIEDMAIYNLLSHSRKSLRALKLSDLPDEVTSSCLSNIQNVCFNLKFLKVKLCDNIRKDAMDFVAKARPGLSAVFLERSWTNDERRSCWHHFCY